MRRRAASSSLHQATGDVAWLELAEQLLDVVLRHFRDDATGGFFDTADDAEALVLRPQDPSDNASPSGWSAASGALLTYAALTASERHRAAAEESLVALVAARRASTRGSPAGGWPSPRPGSTGRARSPWSERRTTRAPPRSLGAARRSTAPGAVVRGRAARLGRPAPARPTARRRAAPAAYVCRHFVCDAPTTDPAALAALLSPSRRP